MRREYILSATFKGEIDVSFNNELEIAHKAGWFGILVCILLDVCDFIVGDWSFVSNVSFSGQAYFITGNC